MNGALITHEFLRQSRDEIIRRWETLVASESRAVFLSGALLRDHLPDLLDALAEWLESSEAPGTARIRELTARHIVDRLDQAFKLAQLIQEYRLLRKALLGALLEVEASKREAAEGGGRKGQARH